MKQTYTCKKRYNYFFSILLSMLNSIITLSYLGTSFEQTKDINKDDWRRSYLIVLSWLQSVIFTIFIIMSLGTGLIIVIFPLLTSIFTLSYLGTTITPTKTIDTNDWKRKWIIFFSWFNLILNLFVLLFELEDDKTRNIFILPNKYQMFK